MTEEQMQEEVKRLAALARTKSTDFIHISFSVCSIAHTPMSAYASLGGGKSASFLGETMAEAISALGDWLTAKPSADEVNLTLGLTTDGKFQQESAP